jgi:hypothetical protein
MNAKLKGDYLSISEIKNKQQPELFAKTKVTALGVGHKITGGVQTSEPSLIVFVESKLDPPDVPKDEMIPKTIGKYKTDVIESGVIFADAVPSIVTLKERIRPVKGGYSVGHYKITAGTIATCVVDDIPGTPTHYYILSNNHVLANSNDSMPGDPILQPGPYDGGTIPGDILANLARFVPIRFDGTPNYVDCAVAEADFAVLNREIYWIGYIKGMADHFVGQIVHKTGRTTGHSSGKIIAINATVNVNYGGGRVANFIDQIITSPISAGGDSGSLVVDDTQENAVGLLFAGSTSITICNNIFRVMKTLKIKFH